MLKLINDNKWDKALEKLNGNYFNEINNKKTLFHYACIRGNEKIIDFYLNLKSTLIFKSDNDGNTGCHLLAINGFDDLVINIVKQEPEFLNLKNKQDKFIYNYVPKVIKIMKQYDQLNNLNYVRHDGKTFLLDLIDNNKDLLEYDYLNFDLPSHMPVLMYAISTYKYDICLKLLDMPNINVNIISTEQFTPLIMSIIHNQYDIVKKLIDKNADINYGGQENKNIPLIICLKKNYIDIAQLLIS